MGFNAGAFAGALGTSALNTFTRLEDNSRAARKAIQEDEVHAAWKKEQDEKAALASNFGDTIGNSATTQRTAIPGTMGVGEEGPVAQMQDSTYTDAQKQADFRARNSAAGVDPMKTLQISAASRSDRSAQKMEDFQNWHTSMVDLMAKGDWAGVVSANLGLYNKPTKGSNLNDGLTAKVIPSADGKSSSFVQYNKKGDVVSSTPITADLVQSKFEDLAFSKYQALDFKGGTELGIKKDELNVKKSRAVYENMRDAGAANYYNGIGRQTGGSNKGTVKNFTVETVDDKGVKQKTPILARVSTDKEGNPKVEAFTLDGKPITDSKVINQIGSSGGGEEGGPSSALGADMGSARKRYENGQIDYKTYKQELADIVRDNGQTPTDKAMPKPGKSFFGDKPKEAPVSEANPSQQPLSEGISVYKTRGGIYYKVPGVATPFRSQAEAETALAELKQPKGSGIRVQLSPEISNSALGYHN